MLLSKNFLILVNLLILILISNEVLAKNEKFDSRILDKFNELEEVKVIIEIKDTSGIIISSKQKLENQIENTQKRKTFLQNKTNYLLSSFDISKFKLEGKLLSGRGVYGKITKEGFEKLIKNPNIEAIYLQEDLHVALDESGPLVNANGVWNLGYTGSGITICVVDSGVDYNHNGLGGCFGSSCKVIGGYDFVNGDSDPDDDNGHGTHVAGIIASEGTYRGIAPDSNLIAVKVCDNSGVCSNQNIKDGLTWCFDNRFTFGISLVSMSIADGEEYLSSSSSRPFWADTEIDDLVNNANIPVIVSSGNTGHTAGVSYPAASPNAISVGAVYDENLGREPDSGTYQSNYGSSFGACFDSNAQVNNMTCFTNREVGELDLLAPGAIITSTSNNGGFENRVGTSMAVPHVSGIIALLLEASNSLSPNQIKNILQNTGIEVGFYRRVDALAAIKYIASLVDSNILTIINNGNSNLIINGINADVPWVDNINETSFTIQPGKSRQINITVNTNSISPGKHIGNIIIYSNDPDESEFYVPIILNYKQPELFSNMMMYNFTVAGTQTNYVRIPKNATIISAIASIREVY